MRVEIESNVSFWTQFSEFCGHSGHHVELKVKYLSLNKVEVGSQSWR